MSNQLFRKKNADKAASPEQLEDYIRVSNPSAWAVLAAFTILLVGICIWGVFGKLDTTVTAAAVKGENGVVCYVRESDRAEIEIGMTVEINDAEYVITDIAKNPVTVDASVSE